MNISESGGANFHFGAESWTPQIVIFNTPVIDWLVRPMLGGLGYVLMHSSVEKMLVQHRQNYSVFLRCYR